MKLYLILGSASTLFVTRLPSFIGFSFGQLVTFWQWAALVHLNAGDEAEWGGGAGARSQPAPVSGGEGLAFLGNYSTE